MCDKYLLSYHRDEIVQMLEDLDENKHYTINISFLELFENDPNLGNAILREPEESLQEWDSAVLKVQNNLILNSDQTLLPKRHAHCRIYGLPACPELHRTIFPRNDDANKFLQVSGTVIRVTTTKMLEYQRNYFCSKCKYRIVVKAEYERRNTIAPPKICSNPAICCGTNMVTSGVIDAEYCKDYQEIKMQETASRLDVGSMPSSMWVTLEDDLVDVCKPGDNITVCGIVKRRWGKFSEGRKIDIELVLKATHVKLNNNHGSASFVTPEIKAMFKAFWKTYSDRPLAARDMILKSLCPQLFGLHIAKLAVAVVLAGGSQVQDSDGNGSKLRAESHLLLVGDPGTGKSQLLRFASKIISRSVLTTGIGSTAAGLTVAAVRENGEWQLEGGALVLADGGICCIDEFNSMKDHDRTSIHEAMEQQTISVAKANIVCKLRSKCSILAATNPKGNIDPTQPLNMNIALDSPLLSRFDVILLLRDTVNQGRDTLVADYILNTSNIDSKLAENTFWTVETLQAYFAEIKKIYPMLTENSNKVLSSYYQAQRRNNYRNKARTTVRLLDSLVRLSQGHARLMHHDEVQVMDAVIAVMLVETAMDAETSIFDSRFDAQSDFPNSPMRNYRELVEIVLKKLQLQDLLDAELAVIDEKLSVPSRDFPAPNPEFKTEVDRQVESKYFHPHKSRGDDGEGRTKNPGVTAKSGGKTSKRKFHYNKKYVDQKQGKCRNGSETDPEIHDENDSDTKEINNTTQSTSRIKRKGKMHTDSEPKRIKVKSANSDVVDDLAVLNLIPSINDGFSAIEDLEMNEQDGIDGSFKFEDAGASGPVTSTQLPNRSTSVSENINSGEINRGCEQLDNEETCNKILNSKNCNEQTGDTMLSQKSRRKLLFQKFKFKPRENTTEEAKNTNVNNLTNSKNIFESQKEEIENLDLDI